MTLHELLKYIKQKLCRHEFAHSKTTLDFGMLEGIKYKKCTKCGYEEYDIKQIKIKLGTAFTERNKNEGKGRGIK